MAKKKIAHKKTTKTTKKAAVKKKPVKNKVATKKTAKKKAATKKKTVAKKKTLAKKKANAKAQKKVAQKKTTKNKAAKKATGKSQATKKSTKKKAVAKKAVAKKAVAKKAVAKKTVAKKTAKKTVVKKKALKQKAATKKTAAKKAKVKKASTKAAKTRATKKSNGSAAQAVTPQTGSMRVQTPSKPSAVQLGKHSRQTYPERSSAQDFLCFGPPATRDGEFNTVRICDLGCFTQDGKDSNKYYHGAVAQHKDSGNWYAYFEWGRTGAAKPSFQFVGCSDEDHAVREFARQLHSKNDRRGEWVTVAGIRTLRARSGKDCYLVRPMATRSTGLPDARSIKINEGAKPRATKAKPKRKLRVDQQTAGLMRDLAVATVAFTRGSMADASLPTQAAIDEARAILGEAQQRLAVIGDDIDDQVADRDIMHLTSLMYGRIPKKKQIGSSAVTWILNKDNILGWQNDLDAFESALYSTDIEHDAEYDPLEDMKISMEWLPPDSKVGKTLHQWWPTATANRHGWIKGMKIRNIWQVDRHHDRGQLPSVQQEVCCESPQIDERAQFQPKTRVDLSAADQKTYHSSNTALLFHGTRSVNVSGILREALRLPATLVGVPITGAMFGPGLYFADDWKKSAGYTSLHGSYWASGGGAVKGRDAFIFACDVVLGAPYVAPRWGGYTSPPDGYHSVYGKAGQSGVQNNEYIVYRSQQHRLRYLCEFTTA